MLLSACLAVLSALLFGMSDFSTGLAARSMRVVPATTVTYGVAAVVLVGSLAATGGHWTVGAVLWGGAAGAFAVLGLLTFYAAMAAGPMSVASPLTGVLEGVVPVVVAVAVGDHLVWWAWLAIGTAAAAGVLLAADRSDGSMRVGPRTLLLAMVSGSALGLSVVALDAAPAGARLLPGVAEALLGLLVLVVLRALSRASPMLRSARRMLDAADGPPASEAGSRAPILAVIGGLLLGCADALLIVALHSGSLAIVGVLISLYPVATVVLARLVLDERLVPLQIAGVTLALLAAATLALA